MEKFNVSLSSNFSVPHKWLYNPIYWPIAAAANLPPPFLPPRACAVKPDPHQQQRRSNFVEATGNFVACRFDTVAGVNRA